MATIEDQLDSAQLKALEAVGQKEVDDAVEQSVQRRVEQVAQTYPAVWWFTTPNEWGIHAWWAPQRDVDLRDFVKQPGNDILAGAISSMVKKFRAMNWAVDGPAATVDWGQELLAEAEFGRGWGTLLGKTVEDWCVCDNGWFWEIIGPGDTDKPLDGLPTGVAHLDSTLCTRTGDPNFPVVFRNPKDNTKHKLHATRVVFQADMEAPNEKMFGVGFSAVSRVLASSQLLLMLSKYKREKLDDLPQAGLLVLNNVVPTKWEEAKAEYERERRQLGNELWANIMTLIGVDPTQPADAKFVSFANLPDHFNEAETITNYVNIVALAFGLDAREFWPVSSGALGTAAESLVMHQKAKGKGIGDLISTIERAINWHLFPKRLRFQFDFTDDEEDAQRAAIEQQKATTILSMYAAADPMSGETLVNRQEARQMLADNVDYFTEDMLALDLTEDEQAEDSTQGSEQEQEEQSDEEGTDTEQEEKQAKPRGRPLPAWDGPVVITPEDVADAIRDWDAKAPPEWRGLLMAERG